MYLGQLFPIDDYKVYGSYTNSQLKLILICASGTTEVMGMKETVTSLWSAFVSAIQNPFQETGKPIRSRKLELAIQHIVERHNAMNQKRRP
jgi:hypothetical protein